MVVTPTPTRITASVGDLRQQFVALRRKRALFHLAVEGPLGLVFTSSPDHFAIAATYEDNGYRDEPLRAKIIAMKNTGEHVTIPFDGGTPDDLIDAMIQADRNFTSLEF